MALAEFRVYLNDIAVTEEQLDQFREIRVDQAIGIAAEAELEVDLILDGNGTWSGIDAAFAQPFQRIRVEVKLGNGDFAPLIDGPIVAQRFELSSGPGESSMNLVVHDDSVLLNQTETVQSFEDMAAHEIVEALFGEFDLEPEVDSVPAAGSAYTRFVVQRGTAMQLLRDLARRHGMFVYVKPGEKPGHSIGVFATPSMEPGAAPELLLLGEDRNIHKFNVEFDALQPLTARAASVQISDKAVVTSEVEAPTLTPLGDDGTHAVVATPGASLLARTREEQSDLDAAATAAVDLSAFAYTANAEIDANDYDTVLSPHQVISVAGPGGHLGGLYLISRVHHVITDGGYLQTLTLKRNARSAGSNGGGLPGSVF